MTALYGCPLSSALAFDHFCRKLSTLTKDHQTRFLGAVSERAAVGDTVRVSPGALVLLSHVAEMFCNMWLDMQ